MTATTTELAMSETPDISVVIPLLNESESLPELAAWIDRVMTANRFRYEAIFIDDGSSDSSWNVIRSLSATNPSVRGIRFRRNYGKSAALYCGFEAARGEVVITMDADLQDSPDEIPELYRMITEEGYDLVSGWKRRRHDPIGKRWPSKLFNATARATSGIRLYDFNCGLKAYRKKVVKSIEVYGRKYGHSKFGWERAVKGYLDLVTVMFLSRFGRSPMYFFGGLGTLMFLFGGVAVIVIIAQKLYRQSHDMVFRAVTDQPLFHLCLLAVVLGVMLFLAGFLGELINRNSADRNHYLIDEEL